MAITSKVNPKDGLTYWKDTSTNPPTQWTTDTKGTITFGTAPKGWTPPKAVTTPTKRGAYPYGDYKKFLKDYGIGDSDYSDYIGSQKTSSLGAKDPEVERKWREGNPNFLKDWNTKHPGVTFEPGNPAHMAEYEPFHYNYTKKGIAKEWKKRHPEATDTEIDKASTELANKLSFSGEKDIDVSAADQKWGNYHRTRREFAFPEDQPVAPEEEEAKDIIPNRGQQYSNDAAYAPFWLQDVINTASAAGNRWGLKKYLPWAPQVQLQTPRPTFYDPTRELANNTEQMAIGTEGAGMFAGPQAFNSRFAQIQGEGAKNAANILANYHNKNVGIANQFENIRTDIYNKNNMLNAGVAQKLYDGTTIANQQFDNAKRQANGEIRDAYTNALTNRAKTQTLNSIYPNFKIDPTQGGTLGFYDGTDIQPGNASTPESVLAAIQKAKGIYTGLDEDTIAKVYGYGDGKSGTRRDQDALNILNNFPQRKGGEVDDDYVEDYRRMKSIFE